MELSSSLHMVPFRGYSHQKHYISGLPRLFPVSLSPWLYSFKYSYIQDAFPELESRLFGVKPAWPFNQCCCLTLRFRPKTATRGSHGIEDNYFAQWRHHPVQGAREGRDLRDHPRRKFVQWLCRLGPGRSYILLVFRSTKQSGRCTAYIVAERWSWERFAYRSFPR